VNVLYVANAKTVSETKVEESLTCDHCGNKLVKTRDWIITGYPYWLRPWGSTLKMSEILIPYACLECGRTIFMLRDIKKIRRDLENLNENEKAELNSAR
jgi:DNA-directed RNA polymerase subunit RPC12/RpoP